MRKKYSVKSVVDALLQGRTVKAANGWSIGIEKNDRVMMWPPRGDGFLTTIAHIDDAAKDFCRHANKRRANPLGPDTEGNQFKTPKDYGPEKDLVEVPDNVLGPDSSQKDKKLKAPSINEQVDPQGQFTNPDMGRDSDGQESKIDKGARRRAQSDDAEDLKGYLGGVVLLKDCVELDTFGKDNLYAAVVHDGSGFTPGAALYVGYQDPDTAIQAAYEILEQHFMDDMSPEDWEELEKDAEGYDMDPMELLTESFNGKVFNVTKKEFMEVVNSEDVKGINRDKIMEVLDPEDFEESDPDEDMPEFDSWSREELQQYLEEWGFGVSDDEPIEDLIEAAQENWRTEEGGKQAKRRKPVDVNEGLMMDEGDFVDFDNLDPEDRNLDPKPVDVNEGLMMDEGDFVDFDNLDPEDRKGSRRASIRDTFADAPDSRQIYAELTKARPSEGLLRDIVDPEKWVATQALRQLEAGENPAKGKKSRRVRRKGVYLVDEASSDVEEVRNLIEHFGIAEESVDIPDEGDVTICLLFDEFSPDKKGFLVVTPDGEDAAIEQIYSMAEEWLMQNADWDEVREDLELGEGEDLEDHADEIFEYFRESLDFRTFEMSVEEAEAALTQANEGKKSGSRKKAYGSEEDRLAELVEEAYTSGGQLLSIPGMYEVMSEHFNNDVLDKLPKRKWDDNDAFESALSEILDEEGIGNLLMVPGAYEILYEEFANEMVDEPEDEPDEEDIFIQDTGVFQGGKQIVPANVKDWDEIEEAILEWMEENNYYPNVWQVSDHGNFALVTDFGEGKKSSSRKPAKRQRRKAGPKLKEKWNDAGDYTRDMEAESAEELYALTMAFGGEEVDWSTVGQPRMPGMEVEEEVDEETVAQEEALPVVAKRKQAAFMEPRVEYQEAVVVDTDMGVETIPGDIPDMEEVRELMAELENENEIDLEGTSLGDYCEGRKAYDIEVKEGWTAEMTAPGYMDKTDLAFYDTEEEAWESLFEYYMTDMGELNEEYEDYREEYEKYYLKGKEARRAAKPKKQEEACDVEAVDDDAKDYWSGYMGEYGKQLSKGDSSCPRPGGKGKGKGKGKKSRRRAQAAPPQEVPAPDKPVESYFDEGFEAGMLDPPDEDNPYDEYTEAYEFWWEGWEEAQAYRKELRAQEGPTLQDTLEGAGIEIDHHESDLYFPKTEESTEILAQFPEYEKTAETFTDEVSGELWYDVPFAYSKTAQAAPPQEAPAPAPAAPQEEAAAPAAPAPKAPAGGKPAAPGAKPAAPGEQLAPGAGDAGIQALGWTPEDIKQMTDEQKQGILQLKLMKPGAQLPVAPGQPVQPQAPPPEGKPAPGGQPAAPQQAPAAPAPQKQQPVMAQIAAMLRQAQAAGEQMGQGAAPVNPTEAAPAQPAAPAAPEAAPQPAAPETPETPENQAFNILQEVQDMDIAATSPKQLVYAKSQELLRRLQTEVGMTMVEAEKLFGVSKGRGFAALFE